MHFSEIFQTRYFVVLALTGKAKTSSGWTSGLLESRLSKDLWWLSDHARWSLLSVFCLSEEILSCCLNTELLQRSWLVTAAMQKFCISNFLWQIIKLPVIFFPRKDPNVSSSPSWRECVAGYSTLSSLLNWRKIPSLLGREAKLPFRSIDLPREWPQLSTSSLAERRRGECSHIVDDSPFLTVCDAWIDLRKHHKAISWLKTSYQKQLFMSSHNLLIVKTSVHPKVNIWPEHGLPLVPPLGWATFAFAWVFHKNVSSPSAWASVTALSLPRAANCSSAQRYPA